MSLPKRLGIILLIFAIAGSYYFITQQPKSLPIAPASQIQTYTDQSGIFSFVFPIDFSIAGSVVEYSQDWSVNATTSGMVLAHIEVPQSFEAGTNFGDARFTVGVSADPSAIAECLTNSNGNFGSTTPVTINGASFMKIAFTGAGAGNRYDTTSYRAVRGNQCYVVEYTIHYGVIENYPVGAVKEFDEANVQAVLDEMAQSFRFLR